MKQNAEKVFGSYYFDRPDLPAAVRRVNAAAIPQHRYDYTEVPHFHDFSELVIVTGGSGLQVIDAAEYPVAAGDVFLLQGFSVHYFPERRNVSLVNIQFDPLRLPLPEDYLRQLPGYNLIFRVEPSLRRPRSGRKCLHLPAPALVAAETLVRKLERELADGSGNAAAVFSALLELIVFVSRNCGEPQDAGRTALLRLGKVISHLENEFAFPWTLAGLARLAGTSPNNFLRLFKRATGASPIDYLLKLRLRRGAELLERSDLSISAIAAECGFNDSNYFSKKFSAMYGESPRSYRKNGCAR